MWQIIVVILGLIFGAFLNKRVREEIKQGKKYFIFFERLILVLFVFILILIYRINILILIGVIVGLLIGKYFKKIYFYFGIVISIISKIEELFLIFISLVFLFGLIYQSLVKFKLKNLGLDIIVFLLPFSLLFMETFINTKIGFLIGFAIGGIISWARGSAW